ncbi:CaiB/BaiF CoA transferase family protein [Methylobacterium pseudosasicola]|uniref:Crotonobetainyl-CoA:carnitine CoA-transferase CaiB n=1 Tax=Methylobacterium pseudosasicola TaxID=582667 RepID=A0A1I4NK02_9HYPH|nr:CoA transferase [Methylobacterium pseudosasicola]SFM15670.1 Crotonobetainyl-CoA:carnitine CoA-transferase CaiB [Methylobacterium pseudosasicola]
MTDVDGNPGILSGLRILEIGHFVAAPFCTRLLADLGAEVIKVEPPAGDPVRSWGVQIDGVSPWWSMHGRNKRCITLNLKHPEGIAIAKALAAKSDALIENFRPGQLAKLGLGEDVLHALNPGLVVAHISGFGQTGPDRDRAAFGVIGEAIGGLRHLTDHAPGTSDLPPVRVGVSIGDSLAGLYAAFGVMAALWNRDRRTREGASEAPPRSIDVALTEAVLSMMEGVVPDYGVLGQVRQPTGSRIATAAPTSAYPTRDGKWIVIAANSQPLFAKLAALIGRPDLVDDPRFLTNVERVENVEALDATIADWTRSQEANAAAEALARADIPATLVYTAAEIAGDPQFRSRGMVREVEDPHFGKVLHAGIVPHIPQAPGKVRWPGQPVGSQTETVLKEILGLDAARVSELRASGAL